MSALSDRDRKRLIGVDRRLVEVVERAFELFDTKGYGARLMVVEGLRTKARQAELYAQGRTAPGKVVTWTLNSKHIDGLAVDCAPCEAGKIIWDEPRLFDAMAFAFKLAADEVGVSVRWGADWDGDGKPREKGESDSPHFELVP